MRMQGMMGSSSLGIFELKEGVDAATIFEGYDVGVGNAALKKLGAPLSFTFEKDVTKHGETPLHRMTMQSEEPALAMVTMMFQYYFAAEGRHLFVAQGMTAETDMKSLIDSVRSGAKKEGAHARAMARLGPERNMGITLNVGALKPMAGMFMMIDPEVAQFFAGFPDEMYTSTAISITREGNLRWKGDWPAKQILDLVNAAAKAQKKAEEAPADEEFD
jgi:hypothetical protein